MPVDQGGYRTSAIEALAAREYEHAGDEYTRAAWYCLASPGEDRTPFEADDRGTVGRGMESLAAAVAAYRVAGRDNRGTHRAVEGVAVARDLATVLDHPVQEACLSEFVADFRVLGGLDGAGDAYTDAAAAYEDAAPEVENSQRWATTPLFEAAAGPIKQLARTTADGEIAVTWDDLHGSDPTDPGAYLASRARYKRRRFPGILASVIEAGRLAAPRGTTEYDNAQYECPDCGATDVNWTGDSVLCMRCSAPMERN